MAAVSPLSTTIPTGIITPIAELGRGALATAYLVVMHEAGGVDRLMVVKRLRPAPTDVMKTFLQAARLSARLNHLHIVKTSEVGVDDDSRVPFLQREYLDGQAYDSIAKRLDPDLGLRVSIHVLQRVLLALRYAHELKDDDGTPLDVVHRHVSPHNVIVTYEGAVKLLDLGVAKVADAAAETRPDSGRGGRRVGLVTAERGDRRADLAAVAVMLGQALTGEHADLEAICTKAKEKRYETASELHEAIEVWLRDHASFQMEAAELGRVVSDLFRVERQKVRAFVEERLETIRSKSKDAEGAAEPAVAPVDERPSKDPVAAGPTPSPASRLLLGAGGLAAAAIIAGIVLARPRESVATPAAAPPEAAEPSKPGEATCVLTIRATPAHAKLYFDDAPLDANSDTITVQRGVIKHRVRGEAEGFQTKNVLVSVEEASANIDLTLDPTPVVASASAPPHVAPIAVEPKHGRPAPSLSVEVAPPPPPAPPPPVPSASTRKRLDLIDGTDPWPTK